MRNPRCVLLTMLGLNLAGRIYQSSLGKKATFFEEEIAKQNKEKDGEQASFFVFGQLPTAFDLQRMKSGRCARRKSATRKRPKKPRRKKVSPRICLLASLT